MPIPDPVTFKTNTSPLVKKIICFTVGSGYGSNMAKVLLALESYWTQKNGPPLVAQRLLYNLWKECGRWLTLKAGKVSDGELFARRKGHIQNLQTAALEELAILTPNLRTVLENYQLKKSGGLHLHHGLKSLAPGYAMERQQYLSHGKASGMTVSMSNVHEQMERDNPHKAYLALQKKGFNKLQSSDMDKLLKIAIGEKDVMHGRQVTFLNKIERLKYMVVIENYLCKDIDDHLISMTIKNFNGYRLAPYAIDKYGNLFVVTDSLDKKRKVVQAVSQGKNAVNYQVIEVAQFNHSTILAGADVVCAGCLHIGWDARAGVLTPGVLSAIDNSSGHYKPSLDDLKRCVSILLDEGIDISRVRVMDASTGQPKCWWGDDLLMRNLGAWPDPRISNRGLAAPPIDLTF